MNPQSAAPWRLSVIVPMLNEAASLPLMLGHWRDLQDQGCELLLVDGGSTDDSVAIARSAGLNVLSSGRGRALQMNAGAARAQGEVLLFLHADTLLPARAGALVLQGLERHGMQWGRFDVRIEGRPRMLKLVAFMMNLRSRWSGIATGDQAIFVRRHLFERVGGFPSQPLMEDVEISRRFKALEPPLCLREKLSTSGRRWESRGVWRTIFLMWRLRLAYWLGMSAERLARAYR